MKHLLSDSPALSQDEICLKDRPAPRLGPRLDRLADLSSLTAGPVLISRQIGLNGRQVTLRLEVMIWDGLNDLACGEGREVAALCADILGDAPDGISPSTYLRVHVLSCMRQQAALGQPAGETGSTGRILQ